MSRKLSQDRLITAVISRMNIYDDEKESLVADTINTYNQIKREELLDGSSIREEGLGIFKLSTRRARAKFGKDDPSKIKSTVTIKSEICYDLKNDYLTKYKLLPEEE